jgi:hypothetical protein
MLDRPSPAGCGDTSTVDESKTLLSAGAPRPMKMGTIAAPQRYDAAIYHALQSVKPRPRAILRYASCPGVSDVAARSD